MEIVILLLLFIASFAHVYDVFKKAHTIRQLKIYHTELSQTITVVVCAHNEEENLEELLLILIDQSTPPNEIIIVLDRCSDKSMEVALKFQSSLLQVIKIESCSPSIHPKKNALNVAIENATSEWILLTDADCRPTRDWVKEMSTGMTPTKEIVLSISPYVKKNGLLNTLIQYETFTTSLHYIAASVIGKTYMGLGRNMAYRKSSFERVGGFGDTRSLTGGDDDLLIQQMATDNNVAVVLTDGAAVDSKPMTSWLAYLTQKTRHFAVSRQYSSHSKMAETTRWSIHLLFWGFFIAGLRFDWQLTLGIFVVAFLMKAISINIVSDRLEKRFNHLWLPFVDLIYVVILPLISLRSLLVKKITWK